jgi:hypothetical protein
VMALSAVEAPDEGVRNYNHYNKLRGGEGRYTPYYFAAV